MYKQIDSNKRKSILLIALFIIVIIALGYVYGMSTDLGSTGIIIAVPIAIFSALSGYYLSDKVPLLVAGAKPLSRGENREIYNLVENLCITAGLPVPKIYVIPDPAPNAFAAGRGPKTASIALTTGLIDKLNKTELEGVIAHELSHVKNYDIRLGCLVVVFVGTIILLSDFFLRFSFFGGRRRSSSKEGNIGAIIALVGIVLAILFPIFAKLIQLAVSRKREFLADASGALLTRYPEGLASALEKISKDNTPMLRVNNAIAHLYISSPKRQRKSWLAKLYSTHPPIEERIERLKKMGENY